MINENIVSIGDAVPSIRKMAKRYGISITPVIEAYRNLELHGILESRTKSGFIVAASNTAQYVNRAPAPEAPDLPQSMLDSDAISALLSSYSGDTASDCYDFNPASLTPPMVEFDVLIQHIIKTLRTTPQLLNTDPHGYDDPMLVTSIAWCMSHYRCIIRKKEICITNNDFTLPLMYALQACLKPNQAVLLTAPCDKCHLSAARQTGHEVFFINNNSEGLDLSALERMLIKKPHIGSIIVSPNFQPPSGISMSSESRLRLGEICAKYNVCIIEDDRNRHLAFSGVCPLPIKTVIPHQTIYIQSLSFPVMPHIQMHWSCPGKYTADFRAHRDFALASPPAFMQRSFASYMDATQHKKDIFYTGERLKLACALAREAVAASFPKGTYCSSPEGGCTLWVELPESVNCNLLADEARLRGISLAVAADYHIQANCIIINYSTIVHNSSTAKGIYKLGDIACRISQGLSLENI